MQTPIERHSVRAVLAVMALMFNGGCQAGGTSPPSQPNGAGGSATAGSSSTAGSSAPGRSAIADAGSGLPGGLIVCNARGGACVLGNVSCKNPDPGEDGCNPARSPGGAYCCLDDLGDKMCLDGRQAVISPADFDTSCTTSSDCMSVPEGDLCNDCIRDCPIGVINRSSFSDYRAAIVRAIGTADIPHVICNCPGLTLPCCLDGKCQTGTQCPNLQL